MYIELHDTLVLQAGTLVCRQFLGYNGCKEKKQNLLLSNVITQPGTETHKIQYAFNCNFGHQRQRHMVYSATHLHK